MEEHAPTYDSQEEVPPPQQQVPHATDDGDWEPPPQFPDLGQGYEHQSAAAPHIPDLSSYAAPPDTSASVSAP